MGGYLSTLLMVVSVSIGVWMVCIFVEIGYNVLKERRREKLEEEWWQTVKPRESEEETAKKVVTRIAMRDSCE